ncbi:rod-binding protein [Kordiimonas aquimaris]|uniref:rod-binding protein n=1 Tax=Kordiimonas aquimaris TaxID=707591 RepID=UPI0021CDFBE9|nr:rod-binding protein [Kordiimonas aquimaris]
MQTASITAAQGQLIQAQINASKTNTLDSVRGLDNKAARETAESFEAVFLSQMLKPMFDTLSTDGIMGGGKAEGMYRDMMVDEVGKSIAKNGGIGIADSIYREILKLQEG